MSLTPELDRWVCELLGENGNFSGFLQSLVEAARNGKFDTRQLLAHQRHPDALSRAGAYLRAKELGMLFEEDSAAVVDHWAKGHPNLKVVRNRIHNKQDGTPPFVADFSVETPLHSGGSIIASVACKSNSREDRLQLALAEAMIGAQVTKRPVITVIPYCIGGCTEVSKVFESLGYKLVTLPHLAEALDEVTKQV